MPSKLFCGRLTLPLMLMLQWEESITYLFIFFPYLHTPITKFFVFTFIGIIEKIHSGGRVELAGMMGFMYISSCLLFLQHLFFSY